MIMLLSTFWSTHVGLIATDRCNRNCYGRQGGKVQAAEVLVLGEGNDSSAKMVKMIPSASSPDRKAPKSGEVSLQADSWSRALNLVFLVDAHMFGAYRVLALRV